jgi:hypothetical protein
MISYLIRVGPLTVFYLKDQFHHQEMSRGRLTSYQKQQVPGNKDLYLREHPLALAKYVRLR